MRTVDPVKHEEKRRQILEAARCCFVRDGFRGVSISALCKEAGISPGHLYHYFESKEAILAELTMGMLVQAEQRFGQTVKNADGLAGLVAGMQLSKATSDQSAHLILLDLIAEATRNPMIAELLQTTSRSLRQLLADYLRAGQAQAQIDPSLDPDIAATMIMAIVDGTKLATVRDPAQNRQQIIQMVQTLISRFLTPPAC